MTEPTTSVEPIEAIEATPLATQDEALPRIVAAAWRALADGPVALPPHIEALKRLEGPAATAAACMAAVFEARLQLFHGDRPGCEAMLARAREALPAAAPEREPGVQPGLPQAEQKSLPAASAQPADVPFDAELVLACDELHALLLTRDGAWAEAHALLAPWLGRLGEVRPPALRFLVLTRQAVVLERQGEFDAALRAHYARLAEARGIGAPLLLALTLATLGGLQSSLLNVDDALPLCQEAWALCRDEAEPSSAACTAGPNLMMVLSNLARHDEAAALAAQLLAREPQFPAHQRPQRLCLYAAALQRAGQEGAAQGCLDQVAAMDGKAGVAGVAGKPSSEWVWTQAALWNGQGRAREALALVQSHLASDAQAAHGVDYPIDAIELHHQAARAGESLGELAAALHHERQAGAARQQALQRAGQARRVTLQIQHGLAAAEQQRDQAQRAQARLTELNARLHEANQAKVRFLAAASHDLRQPLHALTLQTAALAFELQNARQRELLASVEHCAGTLTTMFDALLDLSRAESGVLQPERAAVPLRPLLLRLVEEHRPAAEAKGLGLALWVARRGPPACDSDARLLETLLRNLLGNAIKYTLQGTVLLCARVGWGLGLGAGVPSGASQWRVQVRDSGIGIAADQQARVFEEFYQVGNPARRREQGQGLGLAIVQRLALLLGHALTLRSAPGRGSCFEVRLPMAAASAPGAEQGTLQGAGGGVAHDLAGWGQSRSAAPARGHGLPNAPAAQPRFHLHVAVIEDDNEAQRALQVWLQGCGCRVSLGLNAEELLRAQATSTAGRIDAVLADLRLPGGCDGATEVARLRKRLEREVPALILSGDLLAGPTLERLQARGLHWLRKPVDVARLAQWLAGVATAG